MKINQIVIFICIMIIVCSCKDSTNNSRTIKQNDTVQEDEVKNSFEWRIINEDIDVAFNKSKILIRITEPTDEPTLNKIAKEIRKTRRNYDRLYIFYLLPEYEIGNGAWATSHFDPSLNIQILGATKAELENMTLSNKNDKVLNQWQDTQPHVACMKYLIDENEKLFMKTVYKDGSEGKKELTKTTYSGLVRLNYSNNHGEFYLIENNGNLSYNDSEGKFYEAQKVN